MKLREFCANRQNWPKANAARFVDAILKTMAKPRGLIPTSKIDRKVNKAVPKTKAKLSVPKVQPKANVPKAQPVRRFGNSYYFKASNKISIG